MDRNSCENEIVRRQNELLVWSLLLLKVILCFQFCFHSICRLNFNFLGNQQIHCGPEKDRARVLITALVHTGLGRATGGIKTSARFVLVFFIFLYLSCGLSHCANFILVSLIILDSRNTLRLIYFRSLFKSLIHLLTNLRSSWHILILYWLFFLPFRR